MAEIERAIPFSAERAAFDTFQMVRGLRNQYDVNAQFGTPLSSPFSLPSAPSQVGINDAGIITADWRSGSALSYDADNITDDEILVANDDFHFTGHDDGYFSVPVNVRNWFPADGPDYTPAMFYSISRSWNGQPDVALFGRSLMDPQDGTTHVGLNIETSNADGYADVPVNLNTDGIVIVKRIYDQINPQASPLPDDEENTHLLATVDDPIAGSGGEYGAIGYIHEGVWHPFLQNGRHIMRTHWIASDLVSTWSSSVRSHPAGDFLEYTSNVLNGGGDGYIFFLTVKNRMTTSVLNYLRIGDNNAYPGIRAIILSGGFFYRLNTNGTKASSGIITQNLDDWFLIEGRSLNNASQTIRNRRINLSDLETNWSTTTAHSTTITHGIGGFTLFRMNDYEFSEFAVYDYNGTDTLYTGSDLNDVYTRTQAQQMSGLIQNYSPS